MALAITGCVSSPRLAADPLPDFTVSASLFESVSPEGPCFTVQGVLVPVGGGPSPTVLNIEAIVMDDTSGSEMLTSQHEGTPIESGRFTIEIPLPDTDALLGAEEVSVHLLDADTRNPLGLPIPVRHTPRAWTAELARDAYSALQANNALHANSAAGLDDDASAPVLLQNGWDNYIDPGTPPTVYRSGGFVHLTGTLEHANNSEGTVMILPEGFRPAFAMRPACEGLPITRDFGINIQANGAVSVSSFEGIYRLYLDGVSFRAAP